MWRVVVTLKFPLSLGLRKEAVAMKALVLTYDRCRPIVEHMLKTYEQLWPENPFVFLIPFQNDSRINSYGQNVQMVKAPQPIIQTVNCLLARVADHEWVYWCIDDKFLLAIDAQTASYFAHYVDTITDETITGLSFARARYLLTPPHISEFPIATSDRGDPLLRRYNYNQIWLHQFVRASTLRNLFKCFPSRDFPAIEMDAFTRQGPNALRVPHNDIMYVTQQNFVVFGESTSGGKVTRGCLESMTRFGIHCPEHFDVADVSKVIGSLGDHRGE
jgi:hypothetical protein